MSERYECATCCYATNSYEKFIAHGNEHSIDRPRKILDKNMDNTVAARLGDVSREASRLSVNVDSIDRGLILSRLLSESGFELREKSKRQ